MWEAIIGGGSSLVGGFMDNIFGGNRQRKHNKHQMQMLNTQNAWNLEQWNRQNEYNTPANQMARLKTAGLNPNLMYGQGNTGNASGAPTSATPNLAPPRESTYGQAISGAIRQYIDIKTAQQNSDLVQQEIVNKELKNKREAIQLGIDTLLEQMKNNELFKSNLDIKDLKAFRSRQVSTDGDDSFFNPYFREAKEFQNKDNKSITENNILDKILGLKTNDLEVSNRTIENRIGHIFAKYDAQNLENDFKKSRNKLAELGLTFKSNEWMIIATELLEFLKGQGWLTDKTDKQ